MIPPARTRGPEAQCRALGFKIYFQYFYSMDPGGVVCVSRKDQVRYYNTRFLARGAEWFLDDYVRTHAYGGM